MAKLIYNLDETFEANNNDKITTQTKCVWSIDGKPAFWGYGKTRRQARQSALNEARFHRCFNRPKKS